MDTTLSHAKFLAQRLVPTRLDTNAVKELDDSLASLLGDSTTEHTLARMHSLVELLSVADTAEREADIIGRIHRLANTLP